MANTEIDMSEYMVTLRKYANNSSYFDSSLPKTIITHMFLVIAIKQRVKSIQYFATSLRYLLCCLSNSYIADFRSH